MWIYNNFFLPVLHRLLVFINAHPDILNICTILSTLKIDRNTPIPIFGLHRTISIGSICSMSDMAPHSCICLPSARLISCFCLIFYCSPASLNLFLLSFSVIIRDRLYFALLLTLSEEGRGRFPMEVRKL